MLTGTRSNQPSGSQALRRGDLCADDALTFYKLSGTFHPLGRRRPMTNYLRMGKNVVFGKARQVQPNPIREEAETRSGQCSTALARQHGVELVLERV
jgi:hypothetical protein